MGTNKLSCSGGQGLLHRLLACLVLVGLTHAAQAQRRDVDSEHAVSRPLKVLFVGNSYTYVNNLPAILSSFSISESSPRPIKTKAVAESSATLEKLWKAGAARKTILEQKWDFVVLQEFSTLPIKNRKRMYEYARMFDAEIKKTGAKTVLFLTWARQGNPAMQVELNHAYFALAKELHARVAPVGPAWQIALKSSDSMSLHLDDGSHPTPIGSYLAACVFYLVMSGNVHACPALELADVSSTDAAVARDAAAQATTAIR